MKIFKLSPHLIKVGQKYRELYTKPKGVSCYWQRCRPTAQHRKGNTLLCLHGNAFHTYDIVDANSTKGTHCCFYMTALVTRTTHNVTLYVYCILY
jgi:hypothetical protein